MYDALAMTLTTDRLTAFFSGLEPRVAETQPRIIDLTAHAPLAKGKHDTYRAAMLSVAHEMTKTTIAALMHAMICHVRSLNLPDDQPAR